MPVPLVAIIYTPTPIRFLAVCVVNNNPHLRLTGIRCDGIAFL